MIRDWTLEKVITVWYFSLLPDLVGSFPDVDACKAIGEGTFEVQSLL
jgi:hypothetical protein